MNLHKFFLRISYNVLKNKVLKGNFGCKEEQSSKSCDRLRVLIILYVLIIQKKSSKIDENKVWLFLCDVVYTINGFLWNYLRWLRIFRTRLKKGNKLYLKIIVLKQVNK